MVRIMNVGDTSPRNGHQILEVNSTKQAASKMMEDGTGDWKKKINVKEDRICPSL